jgi:nucleoside-diphosphate-sugar epimerase
MDAQVSGIFHLGSGSPTTLADLLGHVGRIAGPDWPLDIRYAPWRMGEVRRTHTSIAKAVGAFGYSPRTPLESGLEATWRWFSGQGRRTGQAAGDQ